MLQRISLVGLTLLVASCMAGEIDGLNVGSTEQEICFTCGGNGLRKRWAWYWDGTMNPGALSNYGVWNGDHSIDPLCGTAFDGNGQCTASDSWRNWLNDNGNGDATNTKAGNFEYIVKAAGCQGQKVRANGITYSGQFCLAPEALTGLWGPKQKQIITGALIALLNLNEGVPICLATEDKNECCANGYCVEESITWGNVFQGAEVMAVGGGKKDGIYFAPSQNLRLCGVNAETACDVALETWNSADTRCAFTSGDPAWRVATGCDGWDYPVSVHLPSSMLPQIDLSRPRVETRIYY